MSAGLPLSTRLSHILVAFTIELDNEFERRLGESGHAPRVTSLVMWSNFLRFVGDGITVGELPAAAGIPKARTLSTLGGMERWRYVVVGPDPRTKRDGWGSARGLRPEWVVRPTPAGEAAAEIWRPLPDEIERRWEERFGADPIEELRGSLEAIVGQLDLELLEYLPIVVSANGMAADVAPLEKRDSASRLPLSALLSQALLAYTIDFEGRSDLSLPLSANFVRVLDETGVSIKDIPSRAGVSKEATTMALTFLTKAGYVEIEQNVARLRPKGRDFQKTSPRLHDETEADWRKRYGARAVDRLRGSLRRLLDQREPLSRGLQPPPGGWRASKPYLEHTEAMIEDPGTGHPHYLPHYPMVLHRGGWPDGS